MSKEEVEEIKNRVVHPGACEFFIKRAPKKEVDIFKKYANEHYMGDYGALFKQLVQDAIVRPSQFEYIYNILEDIENRLENVEKGGKQQQNPEPNKRYKKNLLGEKIEY